MDVALLEREKEYHEINKKLEMRARELLSQVDNFRYGHQKDLYKTYSNTANNVYEPRKLVPTTRSKSISGLALNQDQTKFDNDELKTLNLPEDINNVGAKGFVHFLKSKVKQLQLEVNKLHQENRNKTEEIRKVQKENAKLQEDKEKFMQQGNIARNQMGKMENQLLLANSKLQAKEGEIGALRKDASHLDRELKATNVTLKNSDVKYQRALDELTKLKSSLQTMKHDEKDMKDSYRKHTNKMTDVIKRLEKQKTELLHGFKRQHVLVDNLKRQKVHIEAIKLNDKIQTDFIKLVSQEPAK